VPAGTAVSFGFELQVHDAALHIDSEFAAHDGLIAGGECGPRDREASLEHVAIG